MLKKKQREKGVALVLLTLGAVIMVFPFLWMILSAFKTDAEIMSQIPSIFPRDFTLENFEQLFERQNFAKYIVNTFIIVAWAFVGMMLSAMAGYGFAKYRFRHKEKYFYVVLATMMVPTQTLLIPVYLLILNMGLLNTFAGMALPAFVSGYTVFLFRQFMSTIPDELIEAAYIDGAGELRTFFSIALPQIKSAFIVQGIISFMGAWNYFLYPLILATDDSHYTLSVAISLLKNQSGTNYGLQIAGATLAVIPVLVVLIFFQRYIKQGFAMDGVKG